MLVTAERNEAYRYRNTYIDTYLTAVCKSCKLASIITALSINNGTVCIRIVIHKFKTFFKSLYSLNAKNHALVLEDCALERTVAGVINSAFGCGGQRCMALSFCFVQDSISDKFVSELKKQIASGNCGLAWGKGTRLGPISYEKHYKEVLADI